MDKNPKALRAVVALSGRTNVGKSSFLKLLAGNEAAGSFPAVECSDDVTEKSLELPSLGSVLFLDTAGVDDVSELGHKRLEKTRRAFDRADVMVLVARGDQWGDVEEEVLRSAGEANINALVVFNRADLYLPGEALFASLAARKLPVLVVNSADPDERKRVMPEFLRALELSLPDEFVNPPPLLSDLAAPHRTVILVVPSDQQAPKGRLILPHQQCLRDALDCGAIPVVCREDDYALTLAELKAPPSLVVCDSQMVELVTNLTPPEIPCTTFSILFSRLKGDMALLREGAEVLKNLRSGDRILMTEACIHHANCDDIGRVKIPRWLQQKIGGELHFDFCAGHEFPADLSNYKLAIHCSSCMLNRRETLNRLNRARQAGLPITNYGMCISYCQGVLDRVMGPFQR